MELDDQTYNKITRLSDAGNKLIHSGKYDESILKFREALELVPEPKTNWEAGTWLYAAIGDGFFFKKEYQHASEAFYNAYNGNKDNPFICLRLGQCLFELDQKDKAEDFLLRAYMLEGTGIFKGDGRKYLTYMRKKYDL